MIIDIEKCIGCSKCLIYCPVNAISKKGNKSEIDLDECVECGCCKRSKVCPKDAIYQQELTWPRSIRSIMSDVFTICVETSVSGRGTEEMKTNDVTGRFPKGCAGLAIEVGRPIAGCRFKQVEKIAMAVAKSGGICFEKSNPITTLMVDPTTGKFKDDVLNEKVYSAILEFAVPIERVPEVLVVIKDIASKIDTVFSLGICTRVDDEDSMPALKVANEADCWISINGKTNVGLGKPFKED